MFNNQHAICHRRLDKKFLEDVVEDKQAQKAAREYCFTWIATIAARTDPYLVPIILNPLQVLLGTQRRLLYLPIK